jgi:branched-chain amino acid transport system permease protein
MSYFFQLLLSGITVGAIYGLVALGFILIYKCSAVFNFAQGELLCLGAYIFYAFIVQAEMPLWVGFIGTFVFAVILALVIERFTLRPMIGQPILAIIMMTIGLSVLLKGVLTLFWAGGWRTYPPFFSSEGIYLGKVALSQQYIYSFIICVALVSAFTYFFRYTKWGLAMRGTAEGHELVQSMGVNVKTVFALAWVIAAVVSAIGGILLGSINGLNLGLTEMGLKVFPAVMIGGLESIGGALIGGVIVGLLEYMTVGYLGSVFGGGIRDIIAYIIILVMLILKPYGLFGWREIKRV